LVKTRKESARILQTKPFGFGWTRIGTNSSNRKKFLPAQL
jgi:hypothetical protein